MKDPTSAYRHAPDDPPLRRWPLRTSARHIAGRAMLVALTIAVPVLLLGRVGRIAWAHPFVVLALVVLGFPAAALAASYLQGRDAEAIARGRGEAKLFDDRIEIPRPRHDDEGEVDVFPLSSTSIAVDHFRTSINFIVTTDVKIAFLVSGGKTRRLSSRLFADEEAFEQFIADIRRLQGGQALPPSEPPR